MWSLLSYDLRYFVIVSLQCVGEPLFYKMLFIYHQLQKTHVL